MLNLTFVYRLEILQHQLRVKKMEEIYEDHVEKIRRTIERKLKQATELLKVQKQEKDSNLKKYEANYAKTLALKAELEAGLDLWRKQVLSVQSQSIRRAEEKVRNDLESRREKLAEEMRSREQKCLEKRKEKEEEKKMRIMNAKKKIEEKEKKVWFYIKISKTRILINVWLFFCWGRQITFGKSQQVHVDEAEFNA